MNAIDKNNSWKKDGNTLNKLLKHSPKEDGFILYDYNTTSKN